METCPTSTIEFISSLHGRQRRRERDLSKRDLQAAVKHGTKECSIKGRWKYTFADVVYITDSTSTKEITSYSLLRLPLEKIDIHSTELHKINEQRRRVQKGIRLHTDMRPNLHALISVPNTISCLCFVQAGQKSLHILS